MPQDRPARLHLSLWHGVLCALCLLALFLLALAGPAHAQQDTASVPDQSAESPATRIEIDEQAGVIRFVIDGEERAVLDADGFHVDGDIDYAGTITDGNRYSLPPADKRGAE